MYIKNKLPTKNNPKFVKIIITNKKLMEKYCNKNQLDNTFLSNIIYYGTLVKKYNNDFLVLDIAKTYI